MPTWYRRYLPVGSLYLRGRFWWYALPLPNGGRKVVSLRVIRKTEAVSLAQELYRKHYRNNEEPVSIEALLAAFERHNAQSLDRAYLRIRQKRIERFVKHAKITDPESITAKTINRFLDERAQHIQPGTLVNERAAISAWCKWLKSRGHISRNPVLDTDPPQIGEKEIIYMGRDEFNKAIEKATELKLWAVHFAAYQALRRHEIGLLRWTDFGRDAKGPTLRVRGKGRKGKKKLITLPLHSKLMPIIEKIPRQYETVFPRRDSKWWGQYLEPIRKVCPTLMKRGQGWHTFRRSFGSILIQEGVRVEVVSRLLRHANIATTLKYYAHLIPQHGREDLERL